MSIYNPRFLTAVPNRIVFTRVVRCVS